MNVHDIPATSARLRHVAGRLGLSEKAYARAREIAGVTPEASQWRALIDRFLLIFGVALIVAGVTSFFAYNWAGLHKFWKFGILEAGIVATVVLAWRRGLDSGTGRSALFASAFLVGILLAVHGQVYQTGADPYGLFVTWALLIALWVVIGRQGGLWMLLLVLVNLSIILFWTQVLHPPFSDFRPLGPLFALAGTFTDARLADLTFALNASVLVSWELFARRGVSWMRGRTFPRVVALLALAPILCSSLILIFGSIFDSASGWNVLALVLLGGFASLCLYYYRYRVHDLFILTVCLLGAIMIVTAFVGRVFGGSFDLALVLAALVVAQTTGAALWLRRVAQKWEEAE